MDDHRGQIRAEPARRTKVDLRAHRLQIAVVLSLRFRTHCERRDDTLQKRAVEQIDCLLASGASLELTQSISQVA